MGFLPSSLASREGLGTVLEADAMFVLVAVLGVATAVFEITGETTAQLQAALPSGFDPTIWAESPSINGGLPYLIANPPQ